MKILIAALAMMVAGLVVVEVHGHNGERGGSGGGRSGKHRDHGGSSEERNRSGGDRHERKDQRYGWNLTLESGADVGLNASVVNGSDILIVKSFDRALRNHSLNASKTIYYSSGNESFVIVVFPRSSYPCFSIPSNLSYNEIIVELIARNGSTVKSSSKVTFNATASPQTREKAKNGSKYNPEVGRECRHRGIVIATSPDSSVQTASNSTNELRAITLDNIVTFIVNKTFQGQGRERDNRGKGDKSNRNPEKHRP